MWNDKPSHKQDITEDEVNFKDSCPALSISCQQTFEQHHQAVRCEDPGNERVHNSRTVTFMAKEKTMRNMLQQTSTILGKVLLRLPYILHC